MTTSRVNTQAKDTADVPLKVGEYVKVAETECPTGYGQHAMLYTNMRLRLKPGTEVGKIRVKGRRRGTTDDTAYKDFTVFADDDEGTEFEWLVTHTWFGARPKGGFIDWYVLLRRNVVGGRANATDADYGKGMNN